MDGWLHIFLRGFPSHAIFMWLLKHCSQSKMTECLKMDVNSLAQSLIFVIGLFCSIPFYPIALFHYIKLPADKSDL